MSFLLLTRDYAPGIALLEINRPKELNALNRELMLELRERLQELDRDATVRVILLTGNDQAFAAGADIREMAEATAVEMFLRDQFSTWDQIRKTRKPLIAVVRGFALGGGCELAMTCDMIIAAENARFGQPEIKIGVLPGAGGTQRLTRAIGKAKAMELILTGKFIDAAEAERLGLITRVVPLEQALPEAVRLAREIANQSPVAVMLAKEAVNRSYDTLLEEGLHFERRNFYLAFATEDQKEGMKAFIEKRPPNFTGK